MQKKSAETTSKNKKQNKHGKLSGKAVIFFFLTMLLCLMLITATVINRSNVERLEMEQLIMDKSTKISDVISRLLYKTEALSALVIQGDGEMENFERVSATICDDPAILNVLIAPDGVVESVYPLTGNEAVVGLDFFSEGAGNKEAALAKETGGLVFGGPFDLVQGGQALVGRLPVYTQENGEKQFWGLVSVTLKYPQALTGIGLEVLEKQGFTYEIWRYNPDDGEPQVIAQGDAGYNTKARFIEKEIQILNSTWYFKVAPVRMWYQYYETWILGIIGLLISFLVAFVMQNNADLRFMKSQVESIARLDYLTGIYNRRYFMETAAQRVAQGQWGSIILFDIDKFKKINDTYGHSTGDTVLIDIAAKVKRAMRGEQLVARYGGEEFVLYLPEMAEKEAALLAEKLRTLIAKKPCQSSGRNIAVTASFGVSAIKADGNLEAAIAEADSAMYLAKERGRNQVVCGGFEYEESTRGR